MAVASTRRSGTCGDALGHLSGTPVRTCTSSAGSRRRGADVFVAFSVAGGTGAGIFYDYLHLIGNLFEQSA